MAKAPQGMGVLKEINPSSPKKGQEKDKGTARHQADKAPASVVASKNG